MQNGGLVFIAKSHGLPLRCSSGGACKEVAVTWRPRATSAVNRQAIFARVVGVVELLFAVIAKMTVALVASVFHRSSTTWSHLGRPLGPHCLGLCQQQQQLLWSLLLLSVCAASCQSAFTEESLFNLQFIFLLPTPS